VAIGSTLELLIRGDHLSKDAGSRLGRIYAGYDARPMRLDQTRLDDAILDDWSGVFIAPFAPKLSFGSYQSVAVDFGLGFVLTGTSEYVGTARFEEGFILDQSRLDDDVIEPSVVRIEAASVSDIPGIAEALMPWPLSSWPGITWQHMPQMVYGGPDGTLGE
jgi:hypothetical protein